MFRLLMTQLMLRLSSMMITPPEPAIVARQRALPERVTVLPADATAVARHVEAHRRAGRT